MICQEGEGLLVRWCEVHKSPMHGDAPMCVVVTTPSSPTTMSGRETALERTTPRPWIAYFTVHGDPHIVTDAARPFATHVASVSTGADDYGRADAALIVAAVNDYDRLRELAALGEAWAAAEAALPEGAWELSVEGKTGHFSTATAHNLLDATAFVTESSTESPAAALQALAVKLREEGT